MLFDPEDASIKKVKVDHRESRKSFTVNNSIFSKQEQKLKESPKEDFKMSREARLTQKALNQYLKKKNKLVKTKRVLMTTR